ncbi:MAG: hypothetical protein DMD65_08030 [Gemmatimonadetes bacterium]|nr:MAG: hypothetical protein DMD65_08030 [Gemmatimonadota bacterium]
MTTVLGWDIGGVNTKAARVAGGSGHVLAARAVPYEIQRDPAGLIPLLRHLARDLGGEEGLHAVTMTAELSQLFRTKREGVAFVLDAVVAAFPGADVHVWGVDGRWRTPEEARGDPLAVAAANWAATARIVGRSFSDCLLLDTGSTTTPRAAARGRAGVHRSAAHAGGSDRRDGAAGRPPDRRFHGRVRPRRGRARVAWPARPDGLRDANARRAARHPGVRGRAARAGRLCRPGDAGRFGHQRDRRRAVGRAGDAHRGRRRARARPASRTVPRRRRGAGRLPRRGGGAARRASGHALRRRPLAVERAAEARSA